MMMLGMRCMKGLDDEIVVSTKERLPLGPYGDR
jgi:hypothetical protein